MYLQKRGYFVYDQWLSGCVFPLFAFYSPGIVAMWLLFLQSLTDILLNRLEILACCSFIGRSWFVLNNKLTDIARSKYARGVKYIVFTHNKPTTTKI
jgi:hypothetical protein